MYLMGYFSIIIMPAGHDDEVRAALLGKLGVVIEEMSGNLTHVRITVRVVEILAGSDTEQMVVGLGSFLFLSGSHTALYEQRSEGIPPRQARGLPDKA